MIKRIIPFLVMIFLAANVCAVLNPSAVYCEEMGYEYKIEQTPEGESGICVLPSGGVEAWDFLKGKEGEEYSYCEEEGYTLKTINDSEKCASIFSNECAVCVKQGEEIEVTTLMNLSFDEAICGDGMCTVVEDYLDCPEDCLSGLMDGYCDKVEDGRCDPDCSAKTDIDCFEAPDKTPVCIEGDGICYSACIGKDSDCDAINSSGVSPFLNKTPESELYPEPEVECIYDGKCYPECMGTDDIDCLCINPKSEECLLALESLREVEMPAKEPVRIERILIFFALVIVFVVIYFKRKEMKKILERFK